MAIRTATSADLDAIMAIENASFPSDAWSSTAMAAELASDYSHYLVDEEDGRVVGYAGLRAIRGNADADIQTIALLEAHRGSGRGRAMLRTLLAEASARDAREVFLEVRADNPSAEGLYLSEGFAEIGRRPRYYQPDDVDAIVMKLDLRQSTVSSGPQARAENSASGGEISRIPPPDGANSAHRSEAEAPDAVSKETTS